MRVYVNSSVWSSIEQNVGVICACLPCLRLLLRSGANWGPEVSGQTTRGTEYAQRSHRHAERSASGRSRRGSSENEHTTSELEIASKMSKSESVGVSTTDTSRSDSDVEKADCDLREKDGTCRTQEVYQYLTAAGERYT